MAITTVNLSDTIGEFKDKTNEVSTNLGDVATLTTDATTAVGAANEMDARLDSMNNTGLTSPKIVLNDSAATSLAKGPFNMHSKLTVGNELNVSDSAEFEDNIVVHGNVNTGGNLHVSGNTQLDGTLTVDGTVNFKAGTDGTLTMGDANTDNIVFTADINSNLIPNTDSAYDLGSSTQQWRDLYIDGVGHIDNVQADDVAVSGTLDVDGATTLDATEVDGTLIVTDSAEFRDNVVVDGNVNIGGTIKSTGTAFTFGDSAANTDAVTLGDTINFHARGGRATNITVADGRVIVGNDIASTSALGVASFSSDNFAVSAAGEVTVKDNGIALGTETTGNYVDSVAGTANEIEVTHTPGEGSTATIGLPNDVTIANDLTVTNNVTAGGNFTVTGNFTVSGTTTNAAQFSEVLSGHTGNPVSNAGFIVDRGTGDSAQLLWREDVDYWELGTLNDMSRAVLYKNLADSSFLGDSSTGNIKLNPEKVEDIVGAMFTGNTERGVVVEYRDSTGDIDVYLANDITVPNDLTVTGNLTVSGTTTTVNTTNLVIEDNIIELNSSQTGTPATSLRSGITVNRGDATDATLQFNENNDKWEFIGPYSGNVARTNEIKDFISVSITKSGPLGNATYDSAAGAVGNVNITMPDSDDILTVISEGEGINISAAGVISGENASTSNKGVASFSSTNFSVSSGAVSIKTGGVPATALVDSSITEAKLTNNSVGTAQLIDSSIQAVHIQTAAVGTKEIANNNVTHAKYQTVATDTIIGRTAAGTGNVTALTASQVRGIINVADGANNYSHPNHSGDVTSTGDGATVIADDAVTYAKMQNISTANRVLGSTTADGIIEETQIKTAMISNDQVTYAKIQNVATANRVLGATTAGAAVGEVQVQTAMIAADAVTQAKIANDAVGSAELKTLSTLLIKNSSGTTLKTIHGAGA